MMTTGDRQEAAGMTVRDAFFDFARQAGLTTVFGNPGSTELRMFKNFPDDFRYVLALQESVAVAAAAGHAIGTGTAALVSLHSAGGVGHSLGAVFNAHRDRVPLVIMAGQQSRAMLPDRPFLGADEPAFFPRPYVKWSKQPERATDVPRALAEAWRVAMTRPYGPVFLSVPEDDWEQAAEPVPFRTLHSGFTPSPETLHEVAEALADAESPVLVVGPGVDEEGAQREVVELAERLNAPVWHSPMSARSGFPEDHVLFQGQLPPVRDQLARRLAGHDLVLVLGAPVFTYHVYSDGPYIADGTRLFHFDCDPAQVAWAPVGTGVLTTVRAGLAALLPLVEKSDRPGPAARPRPEPAVASEPIAPDYAMATLRGLLPQNAVIVAECPTHREILHERLPIVRPGGFLTTGSGALGWGLPLAVGRALAGAGERVVCVIGDGSVMYSVQALWTAAQHQVPLTVVVLNNRRYGAVKALATRIQVTDMPGTELPGLDFVQLAAGLGVPGAAITSPTELQPALAEALQHDGPYLVDVRVTADDSTLYEPPAK